jgi:transposase-like protein
MSNETEVKFPETLHEAIKYFAEGDRAFEYMKCVRWPDGKPACPRCGCDKVSFISTRKLWTCSACKTKKQFTIKVGTILEDSAIGFEKWICAFWLIANAKNGISSYEIGRSLGVTQRTGWFMLQRIRLAMQNGTIVKLGGEVEVDETFIGAKARNMHAKKKRERMEGRKGGSKHLTAVQGLLQRNGAEHSKVILKAVKTVKKHIVQNNVREYVLKGSQVFTDSLMSYRGLKEDYNHQVIDHAVSYAEGKVHTNGLENFWSLLKRTIKGTYVNVEPFHLSGLFAASSSGACSP